MGSARPSGAAVTVSRVDCGERRGLDGDGNALGRVARGDDGDGDDRTGGPSTGAAAGDFTQTVTALTTAAGGKTSTGTVTISASGSTVDSPNESVTVSGTVAGGNGVANPQDVTLTITDDDSGPDATAWTLRRTIVTTSWRTFPRWRCSPSRRATLAEALDALHEDREHLTARGVFRRRDRCVRRSRYGGGGPAADGRPPL